MAVLGRLVGKVAIITGCTSGIGEATVRLFAKEGAKVVMGARREDRGEAIQKELSDEGYETLFVKTDITKYSDCANLVEQAIQKYGRIDILVNNAGVKHAKPYDLHEISDEMRDTVFKTNVYGTIDMCRTVIPYMLKQKKGSIVNISSVAGIVACPHDPLYSAVKGAIKMLSVSMAFDYSGSGIRVNCVCPGLTRTEILGEGFENTPLAERVMASLPLRRFAEPIEIANGILFLAGDEASFACGTVLTLDGGEIIA